MATYSTGVSLLPDIGTLSYNGVTFSPYFASKMSGQMVKDAAGRTVMYMEYTLTVEGYVTLGPTDTTTDNEMIVLRQKLSQQGGVLVYNGRGFGSLNVNGGVVKDVAFGPVPEILEFNPLGAGRGAKIIWTVVTRIPEQTASGVARRDPVLQFNEESSVSYDEEGFSHLSIKGTLEIPLTRRTVDNRFLTLTVDNYRMQWLNQVAAGIDLKRFRVVHREFNVSRDKRKMEWSFECEELPYMGIPPGCTTAHGTYDVKPAKQGAGLVNWMCTLRGTYTVANTAPRRIAWDSFLLMLQTRINASANGKLPATTSPAASNQFAGTLVFAGLGAPIPGGSLAGASFGFGLDLLRMYQRGQQQVQQENKQKQGRNVIILDFSISEGMYLDSRTVTFSCTWRLLCTLSTILAASGLWRKSPDVRDPNLWAVAMRNVQGPTSWLTNLVKPDIIVDFGF